MDRRDVAITSSVDVSTEATEPFIDRASRIQRRTSSAPEAPMVGRGPASSLPVSSRIRRSTFAAGSTALPASLQRGVEQVSGMSMDDVRVHYGSSAPSRLGALAYTEGADIHLGPGQSAHLAHEVWHVVQQKRGAVAPQLKLRGRSASIDEPLELEADRMGAAASRAVPTDGAGLVDRPVRRAVLQMRLPTMSTNNIKLKPDVAQELLLHRLRTMPATEYRQLIRNQLVAPIAELEGTVPVERLIAMYPVVFEATPQEARYTREPGTSSEPSAEHSEQIIGRLKAIFDGMGKARDDDVSLTKIFGVEDEGLKTVKEVFKKARAQLATHGKDKTCPVLEVGNVAHNKWVGVGGMTAQGAPRVDLGASTVADLAAGIADGRAALVHELTHAAASTQDHAYGLTAMAKLGPLKRVENAAHYEHAYLETVDAKDPARYYDAKVSIGQRVGNATQQTTMLETKTMAAMGLLDEMWNTLDNCYTSAQKPIEAKASKVEIPDKVARFGDLLRDLGVFPYNQKNPKMSGNVALALIEDRTRFVTELRHDPDELQSLVKEVAGTKLASLEPSELVASIFAKQLRLQPEVAALWVYYLGDLNQWLTDSSQG
jgi:Domain of unknown function (DUF4157)